MEDCKVIAASQLWQAFKKCKAPPASQDQPALAAMARDILQFLVTSCRQAKARRGGQAQECSVNSLRRYVWTFALSTPGQQAMMVTKVWLSVRHCASSWHADRSR